MHRRRSRIAILAVSAVLAAAATILIPAQAVAVTGGTVVTAPHEYPFIGYLNIRRPVASFGGGKDCGATLIARDYALTAAHCLQDAADGKGKMFRANEATVTFGQTSRSDGGGEVRRVAEFIRPPVVNFDAANVNDVALLRLSSPIDTITPVRLAVCGSTPIRAVFSAGWGRGGGSLANLLQEAKLQELRLGEPAGTDSYQYRYTAAQDSPFAGTLQIGDSGTGLLGKTPDGDIVLIGVLHAFGSAGSRRVEIWERVDVGANQTDFIAGNTSLDEVANGCRPRF